MKDKNIKIIIALTVLFLFDVIKPFRYCLATEFIFLGILFVSLHCSLYFSLCTGIVCGYLKDALSYNPAIPGIIVFVLLCVYVDYILRHFQRKIIKIFIIISAVIMYTFFCNMYHTTVTYGFMLFFISQSILIFFLMNHFLEKWILPQEENDE
ncbi:MAG: hypothetical protein WCI77_09075 [Candidatus Omnitrophota bacterium]